MNVADLLCDLRTQGISLWERDGELRFRAPKGAMTAERRESLRQSKAAILAHLRSRPTPGLHPAPRDRYEPFPLTDLQIAYVLGRRDSFAYGGVGCHGYGEISLSVVDLARLNAAWSTLLERHDMLRAVIGADGTQRVLKDIPWFTIEVLDLRQADPGHAIAELKTVRTRMDHRVYQPDQWPLFDLRVTMTPQGAILHFSIDLLIADFVSTQIILQDLEQLMADYATALPPIDVSYRDYVLAAQTARQSEEFAASRSYWMARLHDLPPAPELPLLHIVDGGSPRFRRLNLELVPDQWSALCAQARALELTPSTAVLALFAEVIGRWSSRQNFTLNVTTQNRLPLHPHIDLIVGDFTAVELLAVAHDPKRRLQERADALQKRLWEDLDHRIFSGTDVLRELARRRRRAAGAFPIVFTSSIGLGAGSAAPRQGLGKLSYGITQTPQVWIDCQAIEDRGALKINWDVREGVFPPGLVEAMFEAFTDVLRRATCDRSLWDEREPVRIPAKRQEQRWNDDRAATPASGALLHEGVVEQALRHPNRPAVIAGATTLTFGELLTRASGVADAIRRAGQSPGELVAVMLEPGWEEPVAVLGILLAGCAYLRVAPDEPSAHRRHLLHRFNVRSVLVTAAKPYDDIVPAGLRKIPLATLSAATPPSTMPERLVTADAPAFVAVEVASADGPSGVAISHACALNAVIDIAAGLNVGPSDRVLALSNLSIGPSVYDFFGVLAAGGCLVMPEAWGRADPAHWIDLIRAHGITLWNSMPAHVVRLIEHLKTSGTATPSLRLALVSGDWLPVTLPRRVQELLPDTQFVMLGTGTASGIWSVVRAIAKPEFWWSGFPYGRAVGGQRLHVLDHALRECPDWVAGDLYSADRWFAGSAWCAKLAAREPIVRHGTGGAPLYPMQARARYRDDGLIELLGRTDRQVVLDGHSVNLSEVEAALAADPQVAWAAALVDRSAADGHRILAVVESAHHPDSLSDALRGRLVAAVRQAVVRAMREPPGPEADLNDAVCASIAHALTAHGSLKPGASLPAVHPQRRRLARRWFRVLERRGLVVRDPKTAWPVPQLALHQSELAARWQQLEDTWGDDSDQSELIAFSRAVAERAPAILDAGEPPISISRDDRQRFVHFVRKKLPLARWAGQTIATIVAELTDAGSGPARILEVGDDPDRGPSLDLNRHYRDQGFCPGGFDIIVSQNALHGTRDLEATIGHLVELLSPGGWIVFSEPIGDENHDWIVGTLECFLELDPATGDFLDRRSGRDQTFMSPAEWRDLVLRHGGELVASTADQPDSKGGIAVFAARFNTGRAPLDPHHLIAAVWRRLPAHMVPDRVEVVSTLPWTPCATIDYRRLQNRLPTTDGARRPAPTAASRELEEIIAALWREVLQRDRLDPVQDFLSAGGDSLKAALLAGHLREAVPKTAGIYFDELLQAILKGGTIADLVAMLQEADRHQRDSGRHGAGPVTVRQLGGTRKPVWMIVPDGVLSLDDVRPLADLLRARNTVLGIEIGNPDELLSLPVKTLVAIAADRCLDAVINDGHLSIAVLGIGRGCPLAVEIARQMADAGGIAERLVLMPAETVDDTKCTNERLRRHWAEACNAWDAGAYAGDITLVVRQDGPDGAPHATQRWSSLCLGEVSVVAKAEAQPARLIEVLDASRCADSGGGQRTNPP